jgi:protein PET100
MFPIAIMYYFGTNLDNRFSVSGFWPKENETHKIPFDKKEIRSELERLRKKRLEMRAARVQTEPHAKHEEGDS